MHVEVSKLSGWLGYGIVESETAVNPFHDVPIAFASSNQLRR